MGAPSPSVRVVLLDPDGRPVPMPEPPEAPAIGEVLRGSGQWMSDHIEQARDFRATAGPRLGQHQSYVRRQGMKEDVVTPLPLRPARALAAAASLAPFRPAPCDLDIDSDSLTLTVAPDPPRLRSLSVRARVRTGALTRRRAVLRIGPSRSGNLTVIELVPLAPRHIRTSSFVTAGIAVVTELAERLLTAVSALEPQPSNRS